MDSMSALTMGLASMGNEKKVFDWDKAADLILERGIKNASAGLELDLEYTACVILQDGNPVRSKYGWLSSTWATPILVDHVHYEAIPCYIMDHETTYTAHTRWPKSAKEKLERRLKK